MRPAAGAHPEQRCGRTLDLFAAAALDALEEKLSPRLRPILALLRVRGPAGATTWELANVSSSLAVHSAVDELREKLPAGWRIFCQRREGTARGRRVFEYVLEERSS